MLATEPQEFIEDDEPALGCRLDLVEAGALRLGPPSGVLGCFCRAPLDDAEHVAEIVRQPGARPSDELSSLGLLELLVQLAAFEFCVFLEFGVGGAALGSGRGTRVSHQEHQDEHDGEDGDLGEFLGGDVERGDRPGEECGRDPHPHPEPDHEPAERQHQCG